MEQQRAATDAVLRAAQKMLSEDGHDFIVDVVEAADAWRALGGHVCPKCGTVTYDPVRCLHEVDCG